MWRTKKWHFSMQGEEVWHLLVSQKSRGRRGKCKHSLAFRTWILTSQEKSKTWMKSNECYFTELTPHSNMSQLTTPNSYACRCRRTRYWAVYVHIYHVWNYLSHIYAKGRGRLIFFMQQLSCPILTLGRNLKRSNGAQIYWTLNIPQY